MKTRSIERRRGRAVLRTYVRGAGMLLVAAGVVAVAAEAQANVRARFARGSGVLTVIGSRENDQIRVSRLLSGAILVNEGAVPIVGGAPDIHNTRRVVVRGGSGNDRLEIDERQGPLPPAVLIGGPGDDELLGGVRDDDLRGGPGRDTLQGRGGDDRIRGDGGNDRIVWYAGDGVDRIDGGAGIDQARIHGARTRENVIDIRPDGRFVAVLLFDAQSSLRLDHLRVERFHLEGGDKNDVITGWPSLGKGVTLAVYAGDGDDVVTGTNGPDDLIGNGGNDTLIGLGGDDYLVGETGDDVLSGGDGDDVLLGGEGRDSIDGGPGIDVAEEGEIVVNVP
ncbi:MAG TPA: calcium-binding protein [Candidatus Binatia bacterium]